MATTGKIGVTTENIFPVIKKFLYSDHEIFLRELVANAVDATQKMKALAASGEFSGELGELGVRIELDEKKKTLKVIDNGIGMTSDEVEKYINQIAFSSAGEFLEKYKDQLSSIIGHFGLGFYSAFMVADKVTIETLSWKEGAKAVKWSCDGSPEYEMTECKKSDRGTVITLYIADDEKEYAELGLADAVVSFELSHGRIRGLGDYLPHGIFAYGRLPLMVTRNCPIKLKGCKNCKQYGVLKDRKGESFEVRCTQRRYSEIYNGKPLYLADKWDEWNSFSFGLLYFTGETTEEIDSVLRSYTETFEKREGVTRGLYYRNVK